MAVSSFGYLGAAQFVDLDLDASPEVLPPTGVTALTLYGIYADNSANAEDVFVKIWDHAGPTVGTTDPDTVVRVEAGDDIFIPFGSEGEGVGIATGLNVACVTTGGTAGTTSPTNDVKATLITD